MTGLACVHAGKALWADPIKAECGTRLLIGMLPRQRGRPLKIYVPFTIRALAVAECLQSATFRVLYVPFIRRLFSMQQVVIGPLGNPLTLADLPRPGTLRWVARRKAEVVAAVEGGFLSTETACAMYTLSLDELLSWQETLARRGIRGLRIRTLSERQHRYSIR